MSHATSQTHATATQTTPHRLLYFFVAFVLLMFFGLIYAWSLFVDPLEAEFGWDRSAPSVVFTLSIITFCAGMLVAGALEERTSPRTVMLITAACLGLGLGMEPIAKWGPWMDLVSIYIIPIGATLGAISWFYVMKKDELLAAVNTGSKKERGALWYNVGRFVYVPLAVILCCVALFMHVAF